MTGTLVQWALLPPNGLMDTSTWDEQRDAIWSTGDLDRQAQGCQSVQIANLATAGGTKARRERAPAVNAALERVQQCQREASRALRHSIGCVRRAGRSSYEVKLAGYVGSWRWPAHC